MNALSPRCRSVEIAWFLAFFIPSAFYCLWAAHHLGATFDEPLYVRAAMEFWHTGSLEPLLKMGTMPLPPVVCMFPVFVMEQVRGEAFTTWNDFHEFLPYARAMTLLFWGLLLWMVGATARHFAGPWAGRLAMALVASEPNLLAHASLATTDIALSAFLLSFIYTYMRGRDRGWRYRILVPACLYALAMLAKASTLAFAPLCVVAIDFERHLRNSPSLRQGFVDLKWLRATIRDAIQIGAIGLGLVFLACWSDWETQPSFVEWANRLPEGTAKSCMVWLADHLAIFPNAGVALAYQIKHNMKGHSAFLLGEEFPRAVWYYFPVIIALKWTIPGLLGILTLSVRRPRFLFNPIMLCALVLFVFSLNCRVQIGLRLIFPVLVFALVALSVGWVKWIQQSSGTQRITLSLAAVGGWIAMLMASISIWPHGLTYLNPIWGDPREGYRLMSDSNYDWAQGLPELKRWKDDHQRSSLPTWYFGTDPAIFQICGGSLPVHEWNIQSVDDFLKRVDGDYLAVCLTNLHGSYTMRPDLKIVVDYLRSIEPIDRTTTFFIYDFRRGVGK